MLLIYKGLYHCIFDFYDYFCTAKLGQNHTYTVRRIQGNILINAFFIYEKTKQKSMPCGHAIVAVCGLGAAAAHSRPSAATRR